MSFALGCANFSAARLRYQYEVRRGYVAGFMLRSKATILRRKMLVDVVCRSFTKFSRRKVSGICNFSFEFCNWHVSSVLERLWAQTMVIVMLRNRNSGKVPRPLLNTRLLESRVMELLSLILQGSDFDYYLGPGTTQFGVYPRHVSS